MTGGDRLESKYSSVFAESRKLSTRAGDCFPSGVTHDARHLLPFPVFVEHAAGAHKTTVDGVRLVDYWMGHGALLLGHCHPVVELAIQRQLVRGTHYSSCHEGELLWAESVQKLIPSAERVRFTSSGTEATLMAVRVARLVTAKSLIVKFIGHFHGWHDAAIPQAFAPYLTQDHNSAAIPEGTLRDVLCISPADLSLVERVCIEHQPACIIVEPSGGHWGATPLSADFLRGLRELTTKHGVILIFDEVITGFRVAPGGAQQVYDLRPDMTTLAKILAGGLPGGALVGRADLLEAVAFNNRYGRKMPHPGTYNGNPLSAAAGVAALQLVATGTPCDTANRLAARLRRGINRVFREQRVPWVAYGEFSFIHILPDYDGPAPDGDDFLPYGGDYLKLDGPRSAKLKHAFRAALLIHGVDWFSWGGMTSAAHTEADIDRTIEAFGQAVDLLRADGFIAP